MGEPEGMGGVRIAQLLSSELTAAAGALSDVVVTDADPDVEPTPDGAYAYAVERPPSIRDETAADQTGKADRSPERETLAEVFVQPGRTRVEFIRAPDSAAAAVRESELRVRPAATRPPRVLVFLADGAAVKRVLPAFAVVAREAVDSSETAQ